MGSHCHEQSRGSITLKVSLGVIRDELHHTMPNGIAHIVSADGYQFENRIDVPAQVSCILFCEDGNLEHHLLANTCVCHDEVLHQFIHNLFRIVSVTDNE